MIKAVCFMARKPGLSRAAFREHYETTHAPMALGRFRFARYVRNHVADSVETDFDCMTEFWYADIEAARSADPDARAVMAQDEERFMDRGLIRACSAEEHVIRDGAETGAKRLWLFVAETAGAETDVLAQHVARAQADRIVLDRLQSVEGPRPPCLAVAGLWGYDAHRLDIFPGGWRLVADVQVETSETPAELLTA